MQWSKEAEETFLKILNNLPQFHRSIAEKLVKKSAEELAAEKNKNYVETTDLIQAFFKEVPPAFREMMVRLFEKLNIDYK